MDLPLAFNGKYNKYHKIEETSKNWKLSKSDQSKIKRNKFCVTEKAHGTNFVFVVTGKNKILCGKRKCLLTRSEYFYGYKKLIKRYEGPLYQLFSRMKKPSKLYVYGELIGGFYPVDGKLKDQEKMQGAVQTGIWYCPEIEFYAFDMAIEDCEGEYKYLDFDIALDCFKSCGFYCAEPIFMGSLDECLNFPYDFQSKIPSMLELPPLPSSVPNKAEGIVIKPMKEFSITTSKGRIIRPMIKRKITEFSEKVYDESVHNRSLDFRKSGEREVLMFEIQAMVNRNRLNAAISKVGRMEEHEKKKVRGLLKDFQKDVIIQLKYDNEKEWASLAETEKYELSEYATTLCKKCIIQYFTEVRKKIRDRRVQEKKR